MTRSERIPTKRTNQQMKKTAVIILFFQLFLSCNGVNNKVAYSQKLEFGYNGAVKKVTTYICEVKFDKIPTDTTNYIGKRTTTFDSLGNTLKAVEVSNLSDYKTEFVTIFSGKGKNRTFQQKHSFGTDDIEENNYKYVWSDDYNFKIVPIGKSGKFELITTSTLDKNFRVIKTTYASKDTIRITDEFKYIGKAEKIHKRTVNEGNNKRIIIQVIVPKEYDQYGNPTLLYNYTDTDKQKIQNVLFTEYEYYEK